MAHSTKSCAAVRTSSAKPIRKVAIVLGAIAATAVLLGLGETAARHFIDAGTILSPVLARHPQFGMFVHPSSPGHDAWGFRNPTIPDRVDIISLGDSMTYGHYASRDDSWPSVLAART